MDLKAITYFISGLSIGAFLLLSKVTPAGRNFNNHRLWKPVVLITLTLFVVEYIREILFQVPLDYRTADMLPVIEIMNERLLSGTNPYSIIIEIWEGIQPIYLPAMYLAFFPAAVFDFDMRWISVISLLTATGLLLYTTKKPAHTSWWVLFPLMVFLIGLTVLDTRILSMSQEAVVLFYYSLLVWSLYRKRPVLAGFACGLCLMSRYALAPWTVLLVVVCAYRSPKKFTARMLVALVMTVFVLMIVGKAWPQIGLFWNLQEHYLDSVTADPDKYTAVISSSIGMARFVEFASLRVLHHAFLVSALFLPLVLTWVYFKFYPKKDWSIYLLASLKLCLVFFVNLLILPYVYLFITSTFLSLFIFLFYVNGPQRSI